MKSKESHATSRKTAAPAVERIYADPSLGLSAEAVRIRTENGLNNEAVKSASKTIRQIVFGNIFTYFNLIIYALATALILVGSFQELKFLFVVIVNTIIGIVQEIDAKKTLDKLNLMSEPQACVVRDGQKYYISTEKLVLDDIVIFSAGNQICADAVVLNGEVQVNESLITGESDEIIKKSGDRLLSGSYVVSGNCRARLERVGKNSFVSQLTVNAKKFKKKERSGMMRSLTLLVKIIGIIIIPMGIALFWRQHTYLGLSVKASVEKTTGALIGMIPEGLYLLANVRLAVSVILLAKKKTLVHDLKCIESLARVDTLCVDKTGTITETSMKVNDIIPLNHNLADKQKLQAILCDFVGNMPSDNATMQSLKSYFTSPPLRRARGIIPFSSVTKSSAVLFGGAENYVLGAPEFLLKDSYYSYQPVIEKYSSQGNRVLLLASAAYCNSSSYSGVTALGLVLLSNKIRDDAKATFSYFIDQGVDIKVISGDNPFTVASAAKEAGIPNADRAVDLSTIKDEAVLSEAALKYTVFGRVTPEQKQKLVKAMKQSGRTVAMTGDGVNDVLALKEADCSVAMASGSEIACQVSDLVLLDSKFSAMPAVVAEGRQVINNIERSASLFLIKNIFSFVLSIISIFALFAYPLNSSQLTLISTLTIGIPAFFLTLERSDGIVKGRFLSNVLFRALPAALTNLIIIGGVLCFEKAFDIPNEIISTVSALLMTLVGFMVIFRMCKPFNYRRVLLLCGLFISFALAISIAPGFFALVELNLGGFLILVVFAVMIPTMLSAITRGLNFLSEKIHILAGKFRKKYKSTDSKKTKHIA